MRKTSLVEAKSHLSELVDAAEHHGQRVLILRRGRPAAAIVPVAVAEKSLSRAKGPRRLTRKVFGELLSRVVEENDSAASIDELLGRNRLDEAI